MEQRISKVLNRSLVALAIFLFFNLSNSDSIDSFLTWEQMDTAYLIYVYVVVMIVWRLCDLMIRWYEKRFLTTSFNKKKLVKLFFIDFGITLPVILAATYFSSFHLKELLGHPTEEIIGDSEILFLSESAQSVVLASLIILWELLKLYHRYTLKVENEKIDMQNELLLSKYESLKNQVNPHFLFNSFSVLSTLIEEDQKMAGKFLFQLSKMYRYTLDNKGRQMVELKKELDFLKSYVFLLKTRHEDAIEVKTNVPDEYMERQLPTLSLQMLIENAVKHNNFSLDEPLIIEIKVEDDYLVVQNRLNKKHAPVQSTRIGLENIRKRYSYQSEKEVIVDQNSGFFTVKLPILSNLSLS